VERDGVGGEVRKTTTTERMHVLGNSNFVLPFRETELMVSVRNEKELDGCQ